MGMPDVFICGSTSKADKKAMSREPEKDREAQSGGHRRASGLLL